MVIFRKEMLFLAVLFISLIAQGNEIIFRENFSEGRDEWSLNDDAAVQFSAMNGRLTISSPDELHVGQASSPWIPVKPSGWYELEYTVCGKTTDSRYIIMPMIGYREISLLDDTAFSAAPSVQETRTLSFQATPVQEKMQLRIVAAVGGEVEFRHFVLREVSAPLRPVAELVLDTEHVMGHGVIAPVRSDCITGIVRVNSDNVAFALFSQKDAGGTEVFGRKVELDFGDNAFSVPVPELGTENVLEVRIMDDGGVELLKLEQPLAHHRQHAGQVTFRDDGMTLVDGKPFFMLAHWWFTRRGDTGRSPDWWYENDLDAADDMVFLKNAGFNTLLVRTPSQAKLAGERGLRVILEYPHRLPGDSLQKEREIEAYKQLNQELRENPMFFAYYGPDEPLAFVCPYEKIVESSALVHQLDPYHPIFYNESPTGSVETQHAYSSWCDVIGRDVYPVPNTPETRHGDLPMELKLSSVGAHTDICRRSVYGRKPVWMILQAFAWHHIYGDAPLKTVEELKELPIAYPTYEESRFMAYNAITHGATGLMWHYLGYTVHVPEAFWCGLRNVLQELNYLQDVLVERAIVNPAMRCDAPQVRLMAKQCQEGNCYFIVNESDCEVQADFTGFPEKSLNTIFNDTPMTLVNGAFSLSMKPYEVRVMRERPFPESDEILHPEGYARYDAFPVLRGRNE